MAVNCFPVPANVVNNILFPVPNLSSCGPVNDSSPAVPCCSLGDICLTNSLCKYTHSQIGGSGFYTAGCTDPNFGFPCSARCDDQVRVDVVFNSSSTGLWNCCGAAECPTPSNETFNAVAPDALITYAIAGISSSIASVTATAEVLTAITSMASASTASATTTSTSLASTSTTSISIASTTTAALPSAGTTPPLSSSLPTGAIVGIAVGAPGVVALLALAWILYKRSRRRSAHGHGDDWQRPLDTEAKPQQEHKMHIPDLVEAGSGGEVDEARAASINIYEADDNTMNDSPILGSGKTL